MMVEWRKIEFLLAVVFLSMISFSIGCSTAESERSRGIQLADEGKWDEAIELLEKYISENPQPAVIEEIDKIPNFYEIENPEELRKYLEAVLYLSASYLGKAGFDIRNVIDYIGEVAKLAEEGEKGNENVEEQTSRIIRDKIFSGLEDRAILERIYYMYKAQRLLERTLYGEEGKIDMVFRQRNKQKGNRIPNLGELQVDIEEQQQLFEVKRLINTIEYIAGKVLIWKTVSISAYLGHFDFYLEEEEKRSEKPLPSLCCKFQGEYPYLITIQNVYHLGYDVFQGIDYLSFGRFSGIDFSEFATRYSEVLGGIKSELDERAEKVCRTISRTFADNLTLRVYDVLSRTLENFTEGTTVRVSRITAKVSSRDEDYKENGAEKIKVEDTGIWLCPRNISGFMEKISFEYLCGEANKVKIDIRPTKPFGIKKEGERYFEIFFRKPDRTYVNCDGERIADTRRTLSVIISIEENVLDTVADQIIRSICAREEIKNLRDEIESFAENPFERKETQIFSEMIDKVGEIVRRLFEEREDPKGCNISQ